MDGIDIQAIVRQAVQEFTTNEQAKSEPAYKAELEEERRRREQLERRLNEMAAENKRSRQIAEEAERSSAVRAELQKLGVAKIDLAYRAVQDGVIRAEDGRLVARGENGQVPLKEYLAGPEPVETAWLSPARQHEEAWFLGLRLNEGVEVAALEREFGQQTVARAMDVVARLAKDGLVTSDGKTVRLTARGRMISNDVFQEFLGLDAGEAEAGPQLDREGLLSR